MRWGYTCSSEEFEASDLVRHAALAEDAGFEFLSVSDHFHPWTHFEQAAQLVTREHIAEQIVCGDDVGAVVNAASAFADAGFTALHFHQVGPDQRGFIDWWRAQLAPALEGVGD